MSDVPSADPSGPGQIDLAEVSKLVAALEADLARAKSGSANLDLLRDEVEALRKLLGGADHAVVPERLHSVRGLLGTATDTVEVDAIKAASYVTQIGRILGLS